MTDHETPDLLAALQDSLNRARQDRLAPAPASETARAAVHIIHDDDRTCDWENGKWIVRQPGPYDAAAVGEECIFHSPAFDPAPTPPTTVQAECGRGPCWKGDGHDGDCAPRPGRPTTVQADDEQPTPSDRMVPVAALHRADEHLARREAEVARLRTIVTRVETLYRDGRRLAGVHFLGAPFPAAVTLVDLAEALGLPASADDDDENCATVQADRDAGQVLLSAEERLSLARAVNALTNFPCPRGINDLSGVPNQVEAAVERILAARQSDPDTTEVAVEVQHGHLVNGEMCGPIDKWGGYVRGELRATHQRTVRRTVTTGEWTEVGE